jgi:hypothetical protein
MVHLKEQKKLLIKSKVHKMGSVENIVNIIKGNSKEKVERTVNYLKGGSGEKIKKTVDYLKG